MQSKLRFYGAALAILSAMLFASAACSGPSTSTAPPGPKETLIIATSIGDAVTLDPQQAYEFSSIDATHELYGNLVTYAKGDTTTPVPQMAEKWEMSPDGMTWTFHLKSGLKFASGNPVTADDVVYSFERAVNLPKNPAAWLITQMGITSDNVAQQVTAPDTQTVQIKLVKSFAPGAFLAIMAYPTTGVVDEKVVKEHITNNDWGHAWMNDHSAGSGPYVLERWDRASQIVLNSNPNYDLGPAPAIRRVIYKHTPESAAQLDLMQKGGADIATTLTAEQLNQLQGTGNFNIIKKPELSLIYLGLDVKNVPAFANPKVRQAVKYAIDYKGIIDHLLSGNGILLQGIIPQGMYGYDPNTPYQQDIAKAKSLLAEAGYGSGFTIDMLAANDALAGGVSASDLSAKLKSDLAQIGITVNVQMEQASELYTTYRAQKSQAVLARWGADYPDPDDFAKPFGDYSTKSLAWRLNWNDPDLSKLVEQAGALPNGDQRAQLYKQIGETEINDGPFVSLYQPLMTYAVAKDVQNVYVNPVWHIEAADVTKK